MSEEIVQSPVAAPSTGETGTTPDPSQNVAQPSPATPGAPKPAVDDERVRGLIADLTKERKGRQQLEQSFKSLQDNIAARDRKYAEVFGGAKSPQEQEAEQAKAVLVQLFPALAKLTPEMLDNFVAMQQNAGQLTSSAQAVWDMRANSVREYLFTKVQSAIGSEKLSDRQQARLIGGLVEYLDGDEQARLRYEAGDNAPVDAYIKEFMEDWFEPARRRGLQTEVGRQRGVPSGRDRSIPTKDKKPIDFSNNKAVEDALVDAFKSQGGKFDR